MPQTPAIIIFRDRVTYARRCAESLAAAGLDVHVVDHESTWPPAVEWLERCPFPVHRLPNGHPRTLWKWPGLRRVVGRCRYVVTDPDVVPDEGAPADFVARLDELLDRYAGRAKAALGLRVDDLPDHYAEAERVRAWESRFWSVELEPGVFDARTDTTLALYPALSERPAFALGPALRTGPPLTARHLPWYEDSARADAELEHYRRHAAVGASHWLDPDLYLQRA
jgi:hypothetical protein